MNDLRGIPETFAPPRVHDVLIRDRLDALLDAAGHIPLILVQGQAAQGKSTLIASYLNRSMYRSEDPLNHSSQNATPKTTHVNHWTESNSGKKGIWLHLSRRESAHPQLFERIFNAVSLSLSPSHPALETIGASKATLGTGEELIRQVEILHSLCSIVPVPISLVLDNLDALEDDASSHRLIKSLVQALLPGKTPVQLILISRQQPSLDISMLKLEHAALILTNDNLAFTPNEIKDYFTTCKGISLSFDAIDRIYDVTHGWAGGLTLIGASLERGVDISRLPHHLNAETLDYFSHEVFDLMPHAIRTFLIKISLFDEIDTEIAEQLCATPTSSAKEMLHYLMRHHLFIHPLAKERPLPTYRLNTLFKNFLFNTLTEITPPREFLHMNVQAARFFKSRGVTSLAIRHAIDGKEYPLAIGMIKKNATDLIIKGHLPNLSHWLEALPESLIEQDPWLIFYQTITKRIKGGRQNVDALLTAQKRFQENNDVRGILLSTAYLIEAAVFLRKSSKKIALWIHQGERLLTSLRGNPIYNWAKALLWQQIAFGYIAGEVDIQKGISACRNARLLAKSIANREIELNATIVMAFGYVRCGNFSEASDLLEALTTMADEGIHPEYRVLNQLIRIDYALKQGDFERAETDLKNTEKDVEKFGLIFLYPEFIELRAMHAVYTEKFDAAMGFAEHLSDFSILSGNDIYLALSFHMKALIHYHGASMGTCPSFTFKAARKDAETALDLLQDRKGEETHLYTLKLVYATLLMKENRFQEALDASIQALDYFSETASDMASCEAESILGLIHWEIQEEDHLIKAETHIRAALTKAVREGYGRLPLMSPNDFLTLLILGVSFDASQNFFAPLTSLMLPWQNRIIPRLSSFLSHPLLESKEFKLNRLRQLYHHFMPQMSINTLGHFSIMIGDRVVPEHIWEGKKPKQLLKSIICHHIRHTGRPPIPKEKIIEDLWPDTPKKSGEKNFKINLHRLRKALEPDIEKTVGYSYLKLESGNVSLDPHLVTLDIDTFDALIKEGNLQLAGNEETRAISSFKAAAALYHGAFLSEEIYEPWINQIRERLKNQFLELLMTLAHIYEEKEAPAQAISFLKKAIETDLLYEEAYQNLMIVYADCNMTREALDLFETYRQTLQNELDVPPGTEIVEIYNKIKHLK